jgi:hypothetical protein
VRWLFIRSKFWLQKAIYQPLASEDLSILRQAVRLELNLNYLVPRLCLGTQCLAGSACRFRQSRGRASATDISVY